MANAGAKLSSFPEVNDIQTGDMFPLLSGGDTNAKIDYATLANAITADETARAKKAEEANANAIATESNKLIALGTDSYSLVDFVNDKIQFNSNDDYLHAYLVAGVTYVFSGDTTYKSFRDVSDNNTTLSDAGGTKADATYTPEKSGVYCLRWYKTTSDTALKSLKLTCSTVGGAHQHLAGLSKMLNTSLENLSTTVATSGTDGLMSKTDKAKLDGIGTGSNVKSVNGKTGAVTLAKGDVGLGSVANLDQSKAIKSITRSGTTFTATALDGTTTTFTQQDNNTTYGVATSSADGLMSKSDKAKLDGISSGADVSQLAKNTAQIETAGTATNAHSAGEYVMISNALYKVTASVAKGDTWTIGTNVTATNVGSEIGSLKSDLANKLYPVGSIYMSVNATNPAELFGGTWEQIKDRFLLAAGDTYAAGSTGGEATHTLTVNEMPSHSHAVAPLGAKGGTNGNLVINDKYGAMSGADTLNLSGGNAFYARNTSIVGEGQAHNNMPPYLTVYMWKRTA